MNLIKEILFSWACALFLIILALVIAIVPTRGRKICTATAEKMKEIIAKKKAKMEAKENETSPPQE